MIGQLSGSSAFCARLLVEMHNLFSTSVRLQKYSVRTEFSAQLIWKITKDCCQQFLPYFNICAQYKKHVHASELSLETCQRVNIVCPSYNIFECVIK